MSHVNETLASQTERVLNAHGWSPYTAGDAIGMDASLIYKMKKGRRVSEATLRRWAVAIGEPVEQWLAWGGYQYVSPDETPPNAQHDNRQRLHRASRLAATLPGPQTLRPHPHHLAPASTPRSIAVYGSWFLTGKPLP